MIIDETNLKTNGNLDFNNKLTSELTEEQLMQLKRQQENEELLTANRLIERNKGIKMGTKAKVVATGYTVIFTTYDENPYREVKTSASGLIMSGDMFQDRFRSDNTGEMEEAEQFISCGKAVSVGPECKYIKEGEDFYYRNSKVPVPFRSNGYYAISEQNIICRIVNE